MKGTYKGKFHTNYSHMLISFESFRIFRDLGNGRTRKPAGTICIKMHDKASHRKGTDSDTIPAYSVYAIELPVLKVKIIPDLL